MAKAKYPLALIVLPDVPEQATMLLEAQGHCLYTMAQAVQANLGKIDGIVGERCWRMPPSFWLKDGALAPTARVMLRAVTTQAYPPPPKKGKRK